MIMHFAIIASLLVVALSMPLGVLSWTAERRQQWFEPLMRVEDGKVGNSTPVVLTVTKLGYVLLLNSTDAATKTRAGGPPGSRE